ncbi:MAG: type II methionyl aminopeptidase [Candidatus Methanomethylicaceae archaeon]
MFTEEEVEDIIKAGKIVREVRGKVGSFVDEGVKVLDVCERVEEEIRRLGGEPAFPCNVGIDNVGAHYTSPPDDRTVLVGGTLVKVDLGAHVNGYVADSAVTLSLGSDYEEMVGVAEEALERGIEVVRVGGKISDVGVVVERTIKTYGYKPVSNLTGHQISRYVIHAGVSVPNITTKDGEKFEAWSIYAIEPFVTLPDAKGEVVNGPPGNILHIIKLKGPKNPDMRGYFEALSRSYRTLPFARRWVASLNGYSFTDALLADRVLYEYPVLVEGSGRVIAQAEHTILTTDKEVIVIT